MENQVVAPEASNVASILAASEVVEQAPKKRGRPAIYANAAERQAAYRQRKGGKSYSIIIPEDCAEAFDAYLKRQRMDVNPDMSVADVIEKLIRNQFMRKR
jgi:hypothetical protein